MLPEHKMLLRKMKLCQIVLFIVCMSEFHAAHAILVDTLLVKPVGPTRTLHLLRWVAVM